MVSSVRGSSPEPIPIAMAHDEFMDSLKALEAELVANDQAMEDGETEEVPPKDVKRLDGEIKTLLGRVRSLEKDIEAHTKRMERQNESIHDKLDGTMKVLKAIANRTLTGEVRASPVLDAMANYDTNDHHSLLFGLSGASSSRSRSRPGAYAITPVEANAITPVAANARVSYKDALLSSKECMANLEPFYGHANKKSEVVDAMFVTQLHSWFDMCCWKMHAAQLAEAQQMSIICQKLQGPVLTAYMLASKSTTRMPNTLLELKQALSALFAESSVHFTDKAISMQFTPHTLVADIKTFETFVMHSSLAASVNQNEFLYSSLRSKLNAAKPNILLKASSEYGLSLDPKSDFDQYVQQALTIAHRVQAANGQPNAPPKRQPPTPAPTQTRPKAPRSAATRPEAKTRRTVQQQELVDKASWSDERLLSHFERCPRCAWEMKDGKHKNGHACDPERCEVRCQAIRSGLSDGRHPNLGKSKKSVSFRSQSN